MEVLITQSYNYYQDLSHIVAILVLVEVLITLLQLLSRFISYFVAILVLVEVLITREVFKYCS